MARFPLLLLVAVARLCDAALREATEQADVLKLLDLDKSNAVKDAADVGWLVNRGWFSAAQKLVAISHEVATPETKKDIATVVRREVGALKQQCDNLVKGLVVQKDVGTVHCAFQWAQNSSCIFLSIKFAHRWSSPGALEVQNINFDVNNASLKFSADGEHSGLKKRYTTQLRFWDEIDTSGWSWQLASAGRMTVLIPKLLPGKWERLVQSKERPPGMAIWPEMFEKWEKEVKLFKKTEKALKAARKVAIFWIDSGDFQSLDANADGLLSKVEIIKMADEVVDSFFSDRYPWIEAWDVDDDKEVNATEWKGKGDPRASKISLVKQQLIEFIRRADKKGNKDGLASIEELKALKFLDDSHAEEEEEAERKKEQEEAEKKKEQEEAEKTTTDDPKANDGRPKDLPKDAYWIKPPSD